MTKTGQPTRGVFRHSCFVIPSSFVIRALSFLRYFAYEYYVLGGNP
jgi:hypothetical protein